MDSTKQQSSQINLADIAQDIFEKYYLQPFSAGQKQNKFASTELASIERYHHGAMHAARVGAYVQALHNLRKLNNDPHALQIEEIAKSLQLTSEQVLFLTKIAALFHDSARQGEGIDKWDEQSAENCYQYLKNSGYPDMVAKFFSDAARYKDNPNAFKNSLKEIKFNINYDYIRELIHDADTLDVMRGRKDFMINRLNIYNSPGMKLHQTKIVQFAEEVRDLIHSQGDLMWPVNIIKEGTFLNTTISASPKAHTDTARKNLQTVYRKKQEIEFSKNVYSVILNDMQKYPYLRSANADNVVIMPARLEQKLISPANKINLESALDKKNIIRKINTIISNLDKELVSLSQQKNIAQKVNNQENQKKFFEKILETYKNNKLSITACLEQIAKHNMELYESVKNSSYFNVIFTDIIPFKRFDESESVQGPREKGKATIALQELTDFLLDNINNRNLITCSYNILNELEITCGGRIYNLTEILKHDPDFDHLRFTDKQLENYQELSKNFKYTPSDRLLKKPKNASTLLHPSEEIAINIYTGGASYKIMQDFLRKDGQESDLYSASKAQVSEILLTICVAAHGLQKPSNFLTESNAPADTLQQSDIRVRVENISQHQELINERHIASQKSSKAKSSISSKGFTSTSSAQDYLSMPVPGSFQKKPDTFIFIKEQDAAKHLNPLGKDIKDLSKSKNESEILYQPGTKFIYHALMEVQKQRYILMEPTAKTILDNKSNSYSTDEIFQHELNIGIKMLQKLIAETEASDFYELFRSVTKKNRLGILCNLTQELQQLLKDSKKSENFIKCIQILNDAKTELIKMSSNSIYQTIGDTATLIINLLKRMYLFGNNLLAKNQLLQKNTTSPDIMNKKFKFIEELYNICNKITQNDLQSAILKLIHGDSILTKEDINLLSKNQDINKIINTYREDVLDKNFISAFDESLKQNINDPAISTSQDNRPYQKP